MSPHQLDHALGLDYFITDTPGIGGFLRRFLEDFFVEELPRPLPHVTTGEYCHFTLEKTGWETTGALRRIARSLGVSRKRLGYAGNKDKRAFTRQRVSAWRIPREHLAALKIPGIRLSDFTVADIRLGLGDLYGNSFRITARDPDLRDGRLEKALNDTSGQVVISGIPNYYGYQRFGTVRPNTHLVGKRLVHGDLEGAVMSYLGSPYLTESADAQHARRYADETRDYSGALKVYPKRLVYERAMLDALARKPLDYAGALRRLPPKLGRLLVQAYQSYLFNRILSAMIEDGIEIRNRSVRLIGFQSGLCDGAIGEIERRILDAEHTIPRDFRMNDIPELGSPGATRNATVLAFSKFTISEDETQDGLPKVVFEFTLPPGSYATVVLREFMKTSPSAY